MQLILLIVIIFILASCFNVQNKAKTSVNNKKTNSSISINQKNGIIINN